MHTRSQVLNKFANISAVPLFASVAAAIQQHSKLHNKSIIFSIRFMAFEQRQEREREREGRVQAVQNVRAALRSKINFIKGRLVSFFLSCSLGSPDIYSRDAQSSAGSICIKEKACERIFSKSTTRACSLSHTQTHTHCIFLILQSDPFAHRACVCVQSGNGIYLLQRHYLPQTTQLF